MKIIKGLLGLVGMIILLITLYTIFSAPPGEVDKEKQEDEIPARRPLPSEKIPEQRLPSRQKAPLGREKTVAIIIDDIGYNLTPVEELLKVPAPIAFAILPFCPHSSDAAEIIHGAHREILLHLPMEPHDRAISPGNGALFTSMPASEIRRIVGEDLEAVPYATGVNNHMGSAFMEDGERVAVVLKELQQRGLFFIDSKTTPHSRAASLAGKGKVRFAARTLFMDNDQDRDKTFKILMNNLETKQTNPMIVIGHPHPTTVAAIKEAVPLMLSRGIRIVPPSELTGIIANKISSEQE